MAQAPPPDRSQQCARHAAAAAVAQDEQRGAGGGRRERRARSPGHGPDLDDRLRAPRVLGALPGWDGLVVAFGFSGHGFKLSPAVGMLLAQAALGQATDVSLAPYRFRRFAEGALLVGRYGKGAVS